MTEDFENEATWGRLRHERVMLGEFSAFKEICERYLAGLLTHVELMARRKGESNPVEHTITDAATTALFNYRAKPQAFVPEKSSLLTYLKMSAWGDYRNLVDKRKRAQQHFVEIDQEDWNRKEDVEAGGFEERLALEQANSLAEKLLKQCAKSNDDRLVFEMLVEKIRDTDTCLQMLGWPSGPENTERLRRAKDRIDKCIKRAGRRMFVEEGR